MPEIVQLGPLMIRGQILILVLACAVGIIHMVIKLRSVSQHKLAMADLLLNAILIIFFSWKLGPLFYEPSLLWTDPLKLLMLPGTTDIAVLGGVVAIAYLSYQLNKKGISWLAWLDAFAYFASGFMLMYGVFTLRIEIMIAGAGGAVSLWIRRYSIGEGRALRTAFIVMGIIGLGGTLFVSQSILVVFLSGEQLLYMVMALFGVSIAVTSEAIGKGINEGQMAYTNRQEDSQKELEDMQTTPNKDSIEQREQEKQNRSQPDRKGIDKKLDGPNRPST